MKKEQKFGSSVCLIEIERDSHTIMTFSNDIWLNLHDGRFILKKSLHTSKNKVVSGSTLFDSIRTVTINKKIVAKRTKPTDQLRYLSHPKRLNYY